ncbi:unnamed protein product [Polarella glacialis]|uniref:Uncharacterized protein n=1 Tax=Polarella glacialis TaxID=89957 RepID=A0A813DZU1_POLGL|nr:unnamed protein product [Polarella glacialis]
MSRPAALQGIETDCNEVEKENYCREHFDSQSLGAIARKQKQAETWFGMFTTLFFKPACMEWKRAVALLHAPMPKSTRLPMVRVAGWIAIHLTRVVAHNTATCHCRPNDEVDSICTKPRRAFSLQSRDL